MTSSTISHATSVAEAGNDTVTVWNPALKDSVGFNGEVVGWSNSFELYNLGRGQRVFAPRMRMFYQMDSLSPLGAGGTNGYAYCLNNPIVYLDPTGHLSWLSGLSIFLAIFSVVLSIVTLGVALAAGATLAAVAAGVSVALSGASAGLHIGDVVARAQGNDALANRLETASLALGAGAVIAGFGSISLLGRAGASVSLAMRGSSAAFGRGVGSFGRNLLEGMELGEMGAGGRGASAAGYISRTSGAMPALTSTALGAITSSSLGRLLGFATAAGVGGAAVSMGAQYSIDVRRNPDRYAEANVPLPSPYVNPREQA